MNSFLLCSDESFIIDTLRVFTFSDIELNIVFDKIEAAWFWSNYRCTGDVLQDDKNSSQWLNREGFLAIWILLITVNVMSQPSLLFDLYFKEEWVERIFHS